MEIKTKCRSILRFHFELKLNRQTKYYFFKQLNYSTLPFLPLTLLHLFSLFHFLSYVRSVSLSSRRKKKTTNRPFRNKTKSSSFFFFVKQLFLILLGKHDSGIQLYKWIKCCYKINNKNTVDYHIDLFRIQFTTLDVILIICFNI